MINNIDFLERIYDQFPTVVAKPSNPLTVDNPDLLVYNGRVLIGVFFPTKAEARNPDDLLRRVYVQNLP